MRRKSALTFAGEGANLLICAHAKIKELSEVADEARGLGVKVIAELCDITDSSAVAGLVKKACDQFGGVDVAINLAGYRAEAKFLEESVEAWNRTIAVNLTGPFNVCRSVIPSMKARGWGRIINIAGIAPYIGAGAAKAMVKLGTVGFTRGLAREFGAFNITVNCVGPGAIARKVEAYEEAHPLDPGQPLHRMGTAEEVISLLVYLASKDAGFITGQCYLVNGGRYFQ
jgi:NAD(P)-dependent dehydrogenase (short-subunit alcohol dehydrogenase family)